MERKVDYDSIEIDGVDSSDYPRFCDAYISKAFWDDGTEMTEEEIEKYIDPEVVGELAMENLIDHADMLMDAQRDGD